MSWNKDPRQMTDDELDRFIRLLQIQQGRQNARHNRIEGRVQEHTLQVVLTICPQSDYDPSDNHNRREHRPPFRQRSVQRGPVVGHPERTHRRRQSYHRGRRRRQR